MDRIVDIATDGLHLSAHRGFLIVSLDRVEQGRVALDDIHALIVHAHGVTWTTHLVVTLAERGAIMVLCAANHSPVALMTPIAGHHAQAGRIHAQWASGVSLRKQLWQQIVIAKVRMQASLLKSLGLMEAEPLNFMARHVRSGDPDNVEAQAARRYWPALLGPDFRRDRDADGANALLNYGYAVMRATVARAVIGAGLHPSIGIHHKNAVNSFALADDLVEPFRPLVDAVVRRMIAEGIDTVTPASKRPLAQLIGADLYLSGAVSPVSIAAQRLAVSLTKSFEIGKPDLALFTPPDPLVWAGIGREFGSASAPSTATG